MSLRMQALLLRFLETGEIQPVGAERHITRVDVRVICATHRDLRQRVREGTFREDLFYRLNVIHIHILPLRERREDVRDLIEHFFAHFAAHHGAPHAGADDGRLDAAARLRLAGQRPRAQERRWSAFVLRRLEVVTPDDLPMDLRLGPIGRPRGCWATSPARRRVAGLTRRLLSRMLEHGESFWDVVYEPFVAHDLTREQLRDSSGRPRSDARAATTRWPSSSTWRRATTGASWARCASTTAWCRRRSGPIRTPRPTTGQRPATDRGSPIANDRATPRATAAGRWSRQFRAVPVSLVPLVQSAP